MQRKLKNKLLFTILFTMMLSTIFQSKVLADCNNGEVNDSGNCVSIESLSDSKKARLSAGCGTSTCGSTYGDSGYTFFFAEQREMPLYGIRITLVDNGGNVVKVRRNSQWYPVTINLWPSYNIYHQIYRQLLLGTFRHLSSEMRSNLQDYHSYCDGSNKKCSVDGNIFNLDTDFNKGNDNVNYEAIFNRIIIPEQADKTYDNINILYKRMIDAAYSNPTRSYTTTYTLDYIIEHDFYFKVEPIFVFNAAGNGNNYYYMGTAYEIGKAVTEDVNASLLPTNFINGAFLCGNISGVWNGAWNVIDNFLTALYLPENISGFTGVNPNTKSCLNGRYKDLLNNEKLGWSKSVIHLSSYKTEQNVKVTVKKYYDDAEKSCYDKYASFKVAETSENLNNVSSQGWVNWCNGSNSKVRVFYVPKGKYYKITEYDNPQNQNIVDPSKVKYTINDDSTVYNGTQPFYVNGDITIKVYNEKPVEIQNCDTELANIISSCGSSKICTNNKGKIIYDLYALYGKYLEKGYNKLYNFDFTPSGSLDVSGVSCQKETCSNSQSIKCDGAGFIESAKPATQNVNNRVCYSDDNVINNSNLYGTVYNDDLETNCEVSYTFKLHYPEVTVNSGMILWHVFANINNYKNPYEGEMNIKITCDGVYYNTSETNISNRKLKLGQFGNILPTMLVKWRTDNLNNTEYFDFETNSQNVETGPDIVECNAVDGKTYCYARWSTSFDYTINFRTNWYSNKQGIYISDKLLSNNDGYNPKGQGLPISVDEPTKNGLQATFNLNVFDNSIKLYCKYNVKKEIIDEPPGNPGDFNFQVRIIDTNNPFPGLEGNGRLVGDNWCVDSRIGKIEVDKFNNRYVVGDVRNNDGIIDTTEYQVNFADFKPSVNPYADIDGDGLITYSNNCNDAMNDYCILSRYATKTTERENNCSWDPEKNYIIQKYITDSPNSSSTDLPMYSFTLTPNEIQNIRDYNRKHTYDESNLVCDQNGKKCKSEFLTNWIKNRTVNGQNITVQVDDNNSRCFNTRYGGNSWCSNE